MVANASEEPASSTYKTAAVSTRLQGSLSTLTEVFAAAPYKLQTPLNIGVVVATTE
jgi:hypothetical protein